MPNTQMQYNTKSLMIMAIMLMMNMKLLSSTDKMLMWMWMEMSNLMFISMILMESPSTSPVMTMLIMQFMSSTMIMMGLTMPSLSDPTLSVGISLKLGMCPFHMWMPMVMYKSPWNICFILLSLYKMPPFMFIPMMYDYSPMIKIISISTIILTLKLMEITYPKYIMAFSSAIHSGWMTVAMMMDMQMWLMYFLIASMNNYMLCNMLNKFNTQTMDHPSKIKLSVMMMLVIMSTVGVPPTIGFMAKAAMMLKTDKMLMSALVILVLSSALSLIYYSRMMMKLWYMAPQINKTKFTPKYPMTMQWMIMLTSIMFLM